MSLVDWYSEEAKFNWLVTNSVFISFEKPYEVQYGKIQYNFQSEFLVHSIFNTKWSGDSIQLIIYNNVNEQITYWFQYSRFHKLIKRL